MTGKPIVFGVLGVGHEGARSAGVTPSTFPPPLPVLPSAVEFAASSSSTHPVQALKVRTRPYSRRDLPPSSHPSLEHFHNLQSPAPRTASSADLPHRPA